MKTTIRNLRKVIREAVEAGDDQFWTDAASDNRPVSWEEAKQHMPADVVAGFETVIEENELNPTEYEFSYGPVTYLTDKYPEEEDEVEDEGERFQAYNHITDDLWSVNDAGEWMCYNY